MLPPGTAPRRSGFSTEMPLERWLRYVLRRHADITLTSFHHLQTNFPLLCSHRRHRRPRPLMVKVEYHDLRPNPRQYQNELHYLLYFSIRRKCVCQYDFSHLDDDDDPDQSPMRPTRGADAGRAQSDGRGSAASPPRVRPIPVDLFPPSDMINQEERQ